MICVFRVHGHPTQLQQQLVEVSMRSIVIMFSEVFLTAL